MAGNWWSDAFANPQFKQLLSEAGQDLGYGLTQSPTIGGAFGIAAQRGQQLQPQRDAAAKALTGQNATASWLKASGDPKLMELAGMVEAGALSGGDAFTAAWKYQNEQSDPFTLGEGQIRYDGQGNPIAYGSPSADSGAGGGEYGLTPIWGERPDGTFGYGVQGKDGSFLEVDTGQLNPLDPRSLAGERAFGTQMGTSQGQGAAAAPGDISTAQTALGLLDQIETSPELPWATGASVGLGGNKIAGTGRYGFQNLVDQAKSGAFLSAIQQMRGMGALSNAEGQVATAAITRMDTALSEADFRNALSDYRAVIQTGMERAQGRVGMQPNTNTPTGQRQQSAPQGAITMPNGNTVRAIP